MSFEIPITFGALFETYPEPYDHHPVAMLQKSLLACAFWLGLFVLFRIFVSNTPRLAKDLLPNEFNQWAMKACCVTHSSFQGPIGVYLFLADPMITDTMSRFLRGEKYDVITSTSANVALFLPITLGFFMYELVCLPIWWTPREAIMVFHHVIPQLLIVTPCFDVVSAFFLITELSSPFVQARWFIDKHLSRTHPLYALNGAVMVLIFFVLRVVPVPHYHMCLLGNLDVLSTRPFHENVFFWLYHCPSVLNVYWFKVMFEGLLKHVFAAKNKATNKKE